MSQTGSTTRTTSVQPRRVEKRSRWKLVGYWLFQNFLRFMFVTFFGIRCFGRKHVPETGGGLVCANHQSHFDPTLLGVLPNRRMNYLARKTLYEIKWLVPFIDFLDAIPLDRGGMGIAGIKETLRRLKRGELVTMYPEGTRTSDGEIAEFKPGFIAIARRAKVPLIPVGICGAYEAWPKRSLLPKPGRIVLCCEKPLMPEDYEHMTDEELLAELERRVRICFERGRKFRSRSLRWWK